MGNLGLSPVKCITRGGVRSQITRQSDRAGEVPPGVLSQRATQPSDT